MAIDQAYIEKVVMKLSSLESELSDPATAANQRKFQSLLAEHARWKDVQLKADAFFQLRKELEEARLMAAADDADMKAMALEEIQGLENRLPAAERALQLALLPPDPADSRNTIVEIRAGTGGEEAALFAADLYRMYTRYADQRGWKTSIIDASLASVGGYKEIIFNVEGRDVYRTMKYESGGHRVQRVPVTEANGRIHTSAATVAVMPEADEIDEIVIKPEDLRIDLFRASGPGGQKVNKTESAVRITHLPTGIVTQSQDERSQGRNRDRAMKVLCARLLDVRRTEEHNRQAAERKSQIGSGDRSERIRTYNFPQNRITDHRIEVTLYTLDRVMEGELGALVDAIQERDIAARLEQEMKS